jgi:epoxyqueuosine reductase
MTGIESSTSAVWKAVGEALDGRGWHWHAVAVERLPEAAGRVSTALREAALSPETADSDGELREAARAELPVELPTARSVVIGALAQPVTQATLIVDGVERTFVVPPHYAGYEETPKRFAALVAEAVAGHGERAAQARVPLKTLAAGSGLARYGRNNIAYVDGLGSYLALAACAVSAPPPADAGWGVAQALSACESCDACARACPTGAIPDRPRGEAKNGVKGEAKGDTHSGAKGGSRFVLRADRCLTMINEDLDPIPSWVDPAWHSCAVGCLRCQQICPANARVELKVEEPVRFSAAESAAILAGDQAALNDAGAGVADRLAACGLDYGAGLIARNLHLLLP